MSPHTTSNAEADYIAWLRAGRDQHAATPENVSEWLERVRLHSQQRPLIDRTGLGASNEANKKGGRWKPEST